VGRSFGREIRLLCALALASALCLALTSAAGAASGTWDRAWGKNVNGGGVFGICTVASSCQGGTPGGLGGEMDAPERIAVDGAGNSYVTEGTSQNRIQKFDSSGAWQRAWGKNVNGGGVFGVCTVASSCLAGSTGGLGGEMNFPAGIAIDGDGNVYVADALNHRIQKFDSSGTWERAWGKNVDNGVSTGFEVCVVPADCQPGTAGGLGGEMSFPVGVATDDSGNVYVVESNRVQKFDSSGTFLLAWGKNVDVAGGTGFETCSVAANCQAGSTGGLGGEMTSPNGAAIAGGFVYVTDQGNNRIQKFAASAGAWQRAWGKNVDIAGGTGFEICTTAANCQAGSTGGLGGEMNSPIGVATDGSANVYVSESAGNRIQRFDSSGAWQRAWGKNVNGGGVFGVCTVASSCLTGDIGSLGGEMGSPRGLGTDASGNLYLADFSNRRVQKFADPAPPPTTPSTPAPVPTTSTITGQRAAALKKCKKKFPKGPRRTKCIKKAKKLPA
jgi:sugar lactone lactonase YvrE